MTEAKQSGVLLLLFATTLAFSFRTIDGLNCSCYYLKEGSQKQTNRANVPRLSDALTPGVRPPPFEDRKLAKLWQCNNETFSCTINKFDEVWNSLAAAFIGKSTTPEAVPVCIRRTFSKPPAVLYGCDIHWTSPVSLSDQRDVCKEGMGCIFMKEEDFSEADKANDVREGSPTEAPGTTATATTTTGVLTTHSMTTTAATSDLGSITSPTRGFTGQTDASDTTSPSTTPSTATSTVTTTASAATSTTSPEATIITMPVSTPSTTATTVTTAATSGSVDAPLICDCKYVRDGHLLQTNAANVSFFSDSNIRHRDLWMEKTAWQCNEVTQSCEIRRNNDVWRKHKDASFADDTLPSSAIPVCTKRTFKEPKAAIYSCGIHWRAPISYDLQKAQCKPFEDDECHYFSTTKFQPEGNDPKPGDNTEKPDSPTTVMMTTPKHTMPTATATVATSQPTSVSRTSGSSSGSSDKPTSSTSPTTSLPTDPNVLICDCYYLRHNHAKLGKKDDGSIAIFRDLSMDNNDIRRTKAAWNCDSRLQCSIAKGNEAWNAYAAEFMPRGVPDQAQPVCTRQTFLLPGPGDKAVLYGCGIHWRTPIDLSQQTKHCVQFNETENCTFYRATKFDNEADVHEGSETEPPDTTTPASTTTPTSLICDCKYVRDGHLLQTNAANVSFFSDSNIRHRDIWMEKTAWQCNEATQSCEIRRNNDVWRKYKDAFFADDTLPSSAIPVCTKRTFKEPKAAIYSCGIHWRAPISYDLQKAQCKLFEDDECHYFSTTKFQPEANDPTPGNRTEGTDNPSGGKGELECDCFYRKHGFKTITDRAAVLQMSSAAVSASNDLRKMLDSWQCDSNRKCRISNDSEAVKAIAKAYRSGNDSSRWIPVCSRQTFDFSQPTKAVLYGCGVTWRKPLPIELQQKLCVPNKEESCVFLSETAFPNATDDPTEAGDTVTTVVPPSKPTTTSTKHPIATTTSPHRDTTPSPRPDNATDATKTQSSTSAARGNGNYAPAVILLTLAASGATWI